MSFDGAFTHAMVAELNQTLAGGRVAKISQPYPNEVVLTVRSNSTNHPLLLSAHPTYARVQITHIPYANPATPSNFTMMLRKYLDGAILTNLEQIENDRIVRLTFSTRNELGDRESIALVIEMMGRHSNVFLIDLGDNRILDLIKHVSPDQNRVRSLLPGATYIAPPKQDDVDPFSTTATVADLVRDYPNADVLAGQLQQTFQGLAHDTALALAHALHEPGEPATLFTQFFAQFDHPTPTLNHLANNKTSFSAFPTHDEQVTSTQTFTSLSDLLDFFYQDRAERERVNEQAGNLIRIVRNELKKNRSKLKKLEQTMAETNHADDFRIKGELLTTYLHQVERGMTTITLPNFYDENKPLEIALSNQIGPSQNAQKYFNRYQKLKNAVAYVTEQIALTQTEIDYLSNIQAQIELASPKDINEIRLELQQQGYIRVHRKRGSKKPRLQVSQPEQFHATDGTLISVGKNNLQNDKLTLHTAKKTDTWLHVKNIPGSHVIIHATDPSAETITEAAELAAYFSKARDSASVPVDYVAVKRVHKPNGAKPGFVIYEGQHTAYVTPDAALVEQIRG
ncbi:NFACT RNA binding domain-containing protein [Furfurilactobacillus entadae]|uniref:NFACT RNA binding domain-containing protein n=1 Tax=Furfurilactobacillus entadae TaxID=2922307 RepID=UPI0035EEB5F2